MSETSMIMACRAVRPQDYDGYRKKLWNQSIASGLSVPPDYPDRIIMQCEGCDIDVQVGPRQQSAMKERPTQVFCLICAVVQMADANETTIYNLGNPHKE